MYPMRLNLCGWLVLLLAFPIAALSQVTQKEGPVGVQIDFPGGTLDNYVAEVRKKIPTANIYVDKVSDIKLEKVNLPKVTLANALEFVTTTTEARERNLLLQVTRSRRESGEVYVLTGRTTTAPAPPPEERLVKCYCLEAPKDGGSGKTPEQIQKAVQEVLVSRSKDGKTTATTKYNPDTCLLTVVGTRADIVLADHVVDEITRGDRATVPALRVLQRELEKLKTEVAELKKKKEQ